MSQRLEWLDIMKGFTMILVVLGHIMNNMDLFNHPVNIWLHRFHMPFFFMLSGFMALKALEKSFLGNFRNKTRTLLFPFVFCGTAYAWTFGKFTDYIFKEDHAGYWFLISLWTCWMVFLPIIYILKRFRMGRVLYVRLFVLLIPFFIGNLIMKNIPDIFTQTLTLSKTFSDYRFFVMGYVLGEIYFNNKKNVIGFIGGGILPICIGIMELIFFVFSIALIAEHDWVSHFLMTIQQILLSFSLFVLLYSMSPIINENIRRVLSHIGKNSLGLYIFHFFFVYQFPLTNMGEMSGGFQFLIALVLSLLVIGATLFITPVFNANKILSFLFLGKKIL